jgi:hypothetical protein
MTIPSDLESPTLRPDYENTSDDRTARMSDQEVGTILESFAQALVPGYRGLEQALDHTSPKRNRTGSDVRLRYRGDVRWQGGHSTWGVQYYRFEVESSL